MPPTSGHQLRSRGAASDPELGPNEFWLKQQIGAKKAAIKATSLPVGAAHGFVSFQIARHNSRTFTPTPTTTTATPPNTTAAAAVEEEEKAGTVQTGDTFTEAVTVNTSEAGVNKDTSPGHATLDQESLKDPVSSKRLTSKRLSQGNGGDKSHKQSPGKSPAKQENKRVSSRVKQPLKKQESERIQHENTSTVSGNKSTADMAPVSDPQDVGTGMKTVVQNMFDVTQTVVGFVPESQNLLVDRVDQLVQNLSHLTKITDPQVSPDNPVHKIKIAPEIVDYVDDGRNPDIFSRDFVERVQRGNMVMKGKQEAFRSFAHVFAEELKKGIGGVDKQVDRVMENAGFDKENEKKEEERHAENGERN